MIKLQLEVARNGSESDLGFRYLQMYNGVKLERKLLLSCPGASQGTAPMHKTDWGLWKGADLPLSRQCSLMALARSLEHLNHSKES